MIKFFIRLKYYFFGTPFIHQKDKMKWVRMHFRKDSDWDFDIK